MASNLKAARLAAFKNVTALIEFPAQYVAGFVGEAIIRIRALEGMSSSKRWNAAVESYASLVEANPDSPHWAIVQGAIFFGYNTEGLM